MGISLEEIERELALREQTGDPALAEIDAELKRRGVQPESMETPLQKTANKITNVVEAINHPGAALGFQQPQVNEMAFQGDSLFDRAGTKVTEFLGKNNVPAPLAALPGTAISMANPMNWMTPPKVGPVRAFEPTVPKERLAGVQAAQELGVPLTRAEQTGAKSTSLLESGLEKSMTGSGTIRKFRSTQTEAIESALQNMKNKFGSKELLSASGEEAKMGMQEELGAARNLGRKLYKDIPDVPIETPKLLEAKNEAMFNQAHLTDPKISQAIKKIENIAGVREPGPTEATSPQPFSKPVELQEVKIPGGMKTIPGEGNVLMPPSKKTMEVEYQSQYRIGPTEPTQPPPQTFQKINDLRNELSAMIQSETTYNPITGPQTTPTGRRLSALKKALDDDIKTYTISQTDPYGKMETGQFKTAFDKANAFHGNVKDLINNKLIKKLSKAQGSDVAGTIFRSGNIEDVLTAKAALGNKGYLAAQKQFFNDILESKNIGRELGKFEPEFLQAAFSNEQLQALKKLDSVKQLALGAEKLAGNPSGTAQNLATGATLTGLGHAALKLFTNPTAAIVEAAAILGIPFATAKAYIGTTHGIPVPAQAIADVSAKAVGLNVIGADSENRKRLLAILQNIQSKKQ